MKRFRFALSKVQRWRGHQERAARRTFAAALAELGRLERSLTVVRDNLALCHHEENGNAGPLALALAGGLRRTEARLADGARLAAAAMDAARAEYLARRRDARAIERLGQRRFAEWREAALAAEQGELEELARLRRHEGRR